MLSASISKKERVGMSAPGAFDSKSDRLPSLTNNGRRFLTNSVNLQHGFGQQVGGSMSVKGSKGAGRIGTGGSVGSSQGAMVMH